MRKKINNLLTLKRNKVLFLYNLQIKEGGVLSDCISL